MEFIIRILGTELAITLGPTQFEEEAQGSAPLDAHLGFGFAIDPLNLDPYWEDED